MSDPSDKKSQPVDQVVVSKKKLNLKSRLVAAAGAKRLPLTEDEISVDRDAPASPLSRLIARRGGGGLFANIIMADSDPKDHVLEFDRDPNDPFHVTDMDPTDPAGRPSDIIPTNPF